MALQKSSHNFTKIALKPLRTNLFNIVLSAFFLTIGIQKNYGQDLPNKSLRIEAEKANDSLIINKESFTEANDTIKKDSLPKLEKKSLLDGKIRYTSVDYAKIDQKNKLITLYNQAELYYQDIELKAGIIIMNYENDEVYAGRIKDSTGTYTQLPVFKQGSNVVEPDSIRYNTKTQKALIWNSRTDQGEFRVKAEITKKENDSVYFLKKARFTTSKDIENPEYYFQTNKIKLVPGQKVVTGLTNMVIADVPTPIAIPFAFFPMTDTSQSGLIIPTFQDTRRQGYSLQNGGYYLALSDHYDLAIMGDYYTNGSWALRFESSYAWMYKFRGNFNIRFENLIQSERGFPDYSKSKIYNIQWSHTQDGKSNPTSRFSASVNLGSSTFFQQSLNQVNIGSTLNNNLSSSISYSKTFNSVPQVNMSLTATHNQNSRTQEINMTLPTLQVSVDRIFPFAPKDGAKKGFFKNINFQYNLRGENRISTTDSLFFKPEMFRDANTGFQHSIPLSTNFKIFKYFSVSTSANYNEVWYLKTINRRFDSDLNDVVTEDVNGFDAFRTYSFSSSVGTTIYGTFNFGETKKIQAIRHVMRPSLSHSYTPSFEQYYDTYAMDGSGRMAEYTRFESGIFGSPSNNYANNLGFNLSNTFEAKMTDKDSTKTEPKKVMLLNQLNFSTSYNMAADSLRWAPVRMSGGTALFENKMNVNFGATLDPYAINAAGRRINTWNIDNGGSLFRMTSANMTINYSLSSQGNKKNNENSQGARNGGREDDLFGTNTDLSDRRQSQFNDDEIDDDKDKPAEFFNAKLPWDLTFAYSLTYGNNNREKQITGNSVMISGNLDITPRWKMGVSSGYDFVQKGVTFTQLRFERDLLSWRMDFNWAPFGDFASWGFFIGIKSSVLSDIKWDKRALPDRQLR
ncbi:MAG TPA: putative LPS assembly protein LptD [Flavobacterium sp.]|uniref:putative LPS assembly protein LptD n=1 Tax=Flavobacterium sp. TaxID=239 RepID=UPI000E8130BE|nr:MULTISPECIES: putative LPS assembly protein LptD [unclassified Flavobacterium]HBI01422.1 organic solvent tolerance protein OstA [Flavobacterium sp.]HRE78055.1 putative LPS assembly protein LptD [Flavobacterium sp.]